MEKELPRLRNPPLRDKISEPLRVFSVDCELQLWMLKRRREVEVGVGGVRRWCGSGQRTSGRSRSRRSIVEVVEAVEAVTPFTINPSYRTTVDTIDVKVTETSFKIKI